MEHYTTLEEMENCHDLYKRIGATIISSKMSAYQNKKGEWKKQFGFSSKWENTPLQSPYNKNFNGFAMLTGHRTGLVAIDIDDPTIPCAIELMALMSDCNMIQKTKKGFHYVYAFSTYLNQTTGSEDTKIDIRSDGGCIFVEPSLAKTPNGDVIATYKWIKTPAKDEAIQDVPEAVIEYLAKLDSRYVKSDDAETDNDATNSVVVEETPTETTSEPRNDLSNESDDVLLKVIDALPIKFLDNYADWIKIGMVMFNEKYTCEQWDNVSKKSKNYESGACQKHWISFAREKGRKVMAASLWKMLKDTNSNAFWDLMGDRQDFWSIISMLNHKDAAKFFYNMSPDAYLWNECLGWFSLTPQNIWKGYEKSQPHGLKRHISDTLQEMAMDTKRAELNAYAKASSKITDKDKQSQLQKSHSTKLNTILTAYKAFGSSEFCNGVISFLASFYDKEDLEEVMDMNRYVFAFTDGCYDLKMCQFRSIQPTDYISTTTGYAYPKASNPVTRSAIQKFLYGLFENKEDDEYLQKVLASCLFGGNRWEEFYCFTGTGGNGKGVISDLLKTAFGDYYLSVDNSLFTKPLERKDQPVPALVEARCKRIMMTTEPESDDKLQGGLIKKISGGDIIEARTLHSKHIVKYVPQFKVILQMNNIPKMTRIDGGIERRMRIINFPFKFVSADKITSPFHRLGDPDVKEIYCQSDEWRNEFILMMTETYKEIKELKNLPVPSRVAEATGDYIDDNNPVKDWLNKFYTIVSDEKKTIGSSDLKKAYMADNGLEKCGDNTFKNLMSFNNIKTKRTSAGVVFIGLVRNE